VEHESVGISVRAEFENLGDDEPVVAPSVIVRIWQSSTPRLHRRAGIRSLGTGSS
jgi:hypothetical protein